MDDYNTPKDEKCDTSPRLGSICHLFSESKFFALRIAILEKGILGEGIHC